MKEILNRVRKWLPVCAIIFALIMIAGPVANAANEEDCLVTTEDGRNEQGSIRRHLIWFNYDDYGNKQYCRQSISFADDVNIINLKVPIALTGSNPSGGEFTLGGSHPVAITVDAYTDYEKGMAEAGVVLNGNGEITTEDGQTEVFETLGKCAMYIKTQSVHLRNMTFTGDKSKDVNGICIDATTVTLENVRVDGFDGDGIRLSSNASNVNFIGDNRVGPGVNVGVRVFGDYADMRDRIYLPWTDATTADILRINGAKESIIKLPGVAQIDPESLCVTLDEGTNVYTITGNVTCEDCGEEQQVSDLHVFRIPRANEVGTGAYQFSYDAGSAGKIVGFFSIQYNANTYPVGRLYIVPETSPTIFASSSPIIELKHQVSCVGGDTNPQGGKGVSIKSGTLATCTQLGAFGVDPSSINVGLDTDGDLIPDAEEMRTFRTNVAGQTAACDCSNTYLCWWKPDSDYDGIPDSKDGVQAHPGAAPTLLDSDGAEGPDAFDTDSDNDLIPDGWEDRSRIFSVSNSVKSAKARYIYFGSDGENVPDDNGDPILCYDPGDPEIADNKYSPDTGVSYGLYYADA